MDFKTYPVTHTEAEWRKLLSPEQFHIMREHGTERKAAWWVLAPGDDGPLEGLGPEADSDEFAQLVLHGEDRRRSQNHPAIIGIQARCH